MDNLDLITTTAGASLYRERSPPEAHGAVMKMLDPASLLPEDIARFRAEYRLLKSLDIPGLIKPIALVDQPPQLVMRFDAAACDPSGEPLEAVLNGRRLDWRTCIRLTCALTRILGGLHGAHLVHRDIRPVNLLMMPDCTITLLDASLATSEPAPMAMANHLTVGDWAYISPEQTGRMNRAVDYRSDFYSLGVTLYRMLTGRLPCLGKDPLEWIHCHIARVPKPPSEQASCRDLPPMASAIVMKLLEKMPEDRYQSAHGLLHDLEACLAQQASPDAASAFVLGTHDVSEHFYIPHKLVGREAEVQQLLASFDAMLASERARLLLVAGGGGVGKSALVHELRQPIAARHGYFISGKFDQYQRDIPYATVTQAFRELVQQILAESETSIAAWCRQITHAVGANGQLIVDVLPQVELIIGAQQAVPELSPAEAQNRFRLVFEQFIGVFAQQAHPLTLFLDDLQWADAGSVRLIKELVASAEQRFLFVIGAYRDNEVQEAGPQHLLSVALADLEREGIAVTRIVLAPLSEAALRSFLVDMLHCGHDSAAPLAHLIFEKTAGNPFFVIQFVSALAEERMIAFDAGARAWRWDLAKISAKNYTDNVAELLLDKLARLPAAAQDVLQRLACLGSSALESTLMLACEQSEALTQAALSTAVRAGLIVQFEASVRFLHDRVQEAAYLSMPVQVRAARHVRIGQLLMEGKTPAQVDEAAFAIVSQFNQGADGIADSDERNLLCQLNFLAGKKARAATAYASARGFLNRAMALLPADAWQQHYQKCFSLTLTLSECEYLEGNFERAEQLADLVLAHAQSHRDCASVYRLRAQLYQMAGRYDDALATMIEAAQLFGIDFPTAGAAMEEAIDAEVQAVFHLLQGRRISEFSEAPLLVDPDIMTVVALLVEAIPVAYLTRPDLFALITAKAVKLSLTHGQTEDACFAFTSFGLALLTRHDDIATAFEFSELALQLNEKLAGRRLKGRLLLVHALAFSPWKAPFARSTSILDDAFAASVEVGDLQYANFVAMYYCWPMLQQGLPLDAVLATARRQGAFALANHNAPMYNAIRFQQQLALRLMDPTHTSASLDGENFNEVACLCILKATNFGLGIQMAYTTQQIAAFLYGHYAIALTAAQQAAMNSYQGTGLIMVDSVHHFYFALTMTALYPQASSDEQRAFALLLAQERERFRVWAEHCPQNFGHCHALIGAEIARIEKRAVDAEQLYEQAIVAARDSGFNQNQAIAFELASGFYRQRGLHVIADLYLVEARAGYLRWGADGKVAQLDARFPQLRTQPGSASSALDGSAALQLDSLSIIKASQAISGRIVFDELSDTLLHIVLESAGAQAGSLLLCGSTGLKLAAQAHVDSAKVQVRFFGKKIAEDGFLPTTIFNYVRRSKELVLLADVDQKNPFSSDPYFVEHDPKSLLCLPILRQQVLIGLLYLENNLVTHAFAPERVAVLKVLASQAAISLENARLYTALQEREGRIRRLVDANIIGVIFTDTSGAISEANDAFLHLSGYSRQDLSTGKLHLTTLASPEYLAADKLAIEALQKTGTCVPYEKQYIRKDGSFAPVLIGSAMIEGSHDQLVSFVLDLSERKKAEDQVFHIANHDALTGLPNRMLFQEHIQQALAFAHRNRSRVAILFIDLDYFKNINDSLGHHIGDVVLQMTAKRLQQCLREGDILARLGGD
ncbi:MAG: AAA family ATPase, partial [Massilia sp.]|nr:AAA family ATPase [Massilia sp.]